MDSPVLFFKKKELNSSHPNREQLGRKTQDQIGSKTETNGKRAGSVAWWKIWDICVVV